MASLCSVNGNSSSPVHRHKAVMKLDNDDEEEQTKLIFKPVVPPSGHL